MGNRAEELRKLIIAGGGAVARHSMNQEALKEIRERQEKDFHPNGKEAKAERRRWEQERFLQVLPKFQFARALGNMFNGMPIQDVIDLAPENIAYVLKHIGEYDLEIGTFNTEKGKEVSITIVDFMRPI